MSPFLRNTFAIATCSLWSIHAFAQANEAALVHDRGPWRNTPIFTVGNMINGWAPPGLLDGLGIRSVNNTIELYANHEMHGSLGGIYQLANGTPLKGARITRFELDVKGQVQDAALAYDRIHDRAGELVTSGTQLNAGTDPLHGLSKLCSASLFRAGTFNLVDDIFFSGEEVLNGQEFALHLDSKDLWCVPWLGRAKFENVTMLQPPMDDRVAILIGDDTPGAPLYLYMGIKDHVGDGSFLDRNGLAFGTLHVFVAGNGALSPQQFNGTGNSTAGSFKAIEHHDPALAGSVGYDIHGFADQSTQYALGDQVGMFRFSRPEDLATDPFDPTRAVLASTGHGSLYPADDWGTTYIVDVDFNDLSVELSILLDGDDQGGGRYAHSDRGLRNPDNVAWAGDGNIYVQEDRSTQLNLFGATAGREVSIWKINPATLVTERIVMIDRSAALPPGQFDSAPDDFGNWETSGIVDVSDILDAPATEIWLLYTVQGHSIRGGAILTEELVEGGQLLLLKGPRTDQPQVTDDAPQLGLHLFPVPVSTTLFIQLVEPTGGPLEIQVIDSQGRVVLSTSKERKAHRYVQEVNVSTLSPGMYIAQVRSGGNVSSARFMKE